MAQKAQAETRCWSCHNSVGVSSEYVDVPVIILLASKVARRIDVKF